MKQFANPVIELSIFAMADVVTTSGNLGGGENELPTLPRTGDASVASSAADAFA